MGIPQENKQKEWTEIIENQRKSGLSIQKWCLENQISPRIFRYWKDKLFPKVTIQVPPAARPE